MKKEAFLQALERRLEGMSAEERARALAWRKAGGKDLSA